MTASSQTSRRRPAGTVVGYAEQTHKCCSCSSWIKVYDAAGTLIYTLTSEWPIVLVWHSGLKSEQLSSQAAASLASSAGASSVGLHPVVCVRPVGAICKALCQVPVLTVILPKRCGHLRLLGSGHAVPKPTPLHKYALRYWLRQLRLPHNRVQSWLCNDLHTHNRTRTLLARQNCFSGQDCGLSQCCQKEMMHTACPQAASHFLLSGRNSGSA